MRGLTPAERRELAEACVPVLLNQHEVDEATPGEAAVYEQLKRDGRVVEVEWENETHYGIVWLATDLGRLALRACPEHESV